ncbi:MAG: YraN family protein [Clostridiales bacterium]|nr:YraN family protein [Clostridiales bacterium]
MRNSPQDVHKKVLGKKGERLALSYLKKQGYKILQTNYRTPFGEADIVAMDGDEIAFIEVKTRTDDKYGAPKEAVGAEKQKRYYQLARYYGAKTGEEPNARFDVIEVYADGKIEYYKYAF